MRIYESVMLWLCALGGLIYRGFMKHFPTWGAALGLVTAYGIVRGSEFGQIKSQHIPWLIVVALAYTALAVLHAYAELKSHSGKDNE